MTTKPLQAVVTEALQAMAKVTKAVAKVFLAVAVILFAIAVVLLAITEVLLAVAVVMFTIAGAISKAMTMTKASSAVSMNAFSIAFSVASMASIA